MQGYIELGKMGVGDYRMEIYHSWLALSVDMPYSFTVERETPHLLVLRITADLECS